MHYDTIPELPIFTRSEMFGANAETALKEFMNSNTRFVFYKSSDGQIRFFFDNLDDDLYAAMVVALNHPTNEKLYFFLKLMIEGARLIRRNNKHATELAVKIERAIRNNTYC